MFNILSKWSKFILGKSGDLLQINQILKGRHYSSRIPRNKIFFDGAISDE